MSALVPLLAAALAGAAEACPPDAPEGMVARAARFGGAVAPTAAEAGEAAAAGDLARHAARRFLGLEPPPFLIAVGFAGPPPAPGGCAFVFPWSFGPGRGHASRLPGHVLPHEIGHTLFIRFLAPRTGKDEYGGGAPDWLDEMAAVAFEDPAGVRMRRGEARRHAERGMLIPLERLLAMPHPEWIARRGGPGEARSPGTSQPGSSETPAFYATVRALLDFLIARTGDEQVIRRLADRARAGEPLDPWLLAAARPRTGASELSMLDAQLLAFVLTDAAYAATREHAAPPKEGR